MIIVSAGSESVPARKILLLNQFNATAQEYNTQVIEHNKSKAQYKRCTKIQKQQRSKGIGIGTGEVFLGPVVTPIKE